jgi:alpha-1,6-mannosyltransferase
MLPPMSLNGPLGATQSGGIELRSSAVDVRARASRTLAGRVALLGLLVTGFVIAIAAAQTDSLLPETARPAPRSLAGLFGQTGLNLHVAGLVAVLSVMFICYAVAVYTAERLSGRVVLACIAALYALMLLAPPLVSTDVFSYQAYARMGTVYGANPYLHGPQAIALDPVYPFIGARWVAVPSAYGPIFTVLSYVMAPLSIASGILVYKAIAAVSTLALVALVWNTARLRGVDPVKAAAFVGLNPMVAVYGVGGGHNDLLMLAMMVAGISLLLQHRDRAGAAGIVLATGVKLTAAMILPFVLAGAASPLTRSRRRDLLIGGGIAAAFVAALGFAVFGAGPLHLLGTLAKSQTEGDWHSIPGFVSTRLGLGALGSATRVVLAVVFVLVFAWLVRRVWRGELDWIDGAAWASAALLVTASSLLPWYVAWLMPLAALARDRRIVRVALGLTGLVQFIQMLGYIPHGSSLFGI